MSALDLTNISKDSVVITDGINDYIMDTTCLSNLGYTLGKQIGEHSARAVIYEICKRTCKHVAKIALKSQEEYWNREVDAAILASKEGLGPQVIAVVECSLISLFGKSTHKIIIMEKLETTYRENRNDRALEKLLLKYIENKTKLVHGDLHIGNIMFKKDRAYMIDWTKIGEGDVLYSRLYDLSNYAYLPCIKEFVRAKYSTYINALPDDTPEHEMIKKYFIKQFLN